MPNMQLPQDPATWDAMGRFVGFVGIPSIIVAIGFGAFLYWFFWHWVPASKAREADERQIFRTAIEKQVTTCEEARQNSEQRFTETLATSRRDFLDEQARVADRTNKILDAHNGTVQQLFQLYRELSGRRT